MAAHAGCMGCTSPTRELFACLLPEQRARLASSAVPHAYRAHESLFHEGTPALALHCVHAGAVKLFRRLYSGEEVVVGVRGAGDLVGLRGVLAGIPYATTAMTLGPATVCAIPGATLLALLRENAALAVRLLGRLALESRQAEDELVERAHCGVGQRTARFLVRWLAPADAAACAPRGEAAPALGREEMARLIGTTPESLSRTLHAFAREGLLALEARRIRVLDPVALRRRAE